MGKKAKSKKTNPNNIPRTQADCDRAWERGVLDGVNNASAIFLTVLVDKFNGGDYIVEVWHEIEKLSEEVAEHRVTVADLRATLREEYGVEV